MTNWEKVKIGSFLKVREVRIKPPEANEMGLKRIEKIDFSGKIYLAENKSTRTDMIIVKSGDLVISGINVEKGALAVYEGIEDVLATIHYSSYEFDSNKVDIEYLKWFLRSNAFVELLKSQTKNGIKTELKSKHFLPIEICLPDLETQKQIAAKINNMSEEIKELSGNNQYNLDLIQKLRQAILQEAVQGKLVPQNPDDEPASELLKKIKAEKEKLIKEGKIKKDKEIIVITKNEEPFPLPLNWVWSNPQLLCEKITDGTHKTPTYLTNGIPFLSAKNIINGKLSFDDCKYVSEEEYEQLVQRCNPKEGSILLTKSGSIGRLTIVNTDKKFCLFESVAVLIPLYGIDPVFLSYCLQLSSNGISSSQYIKGVAVKHLHLNEIRKMPIPIPPHEEQKRIVEKVDSLMALCDELESQIKQSKNHSEQLMQSVLQEAFNSEPVADFVEA